MLDLNEVEITQNQCFVSHVYEIQLATGEALTTLNAHLLREILAIRAAGEQGIEYPGAGWQTPHDLIQRPAFAPLFDAIGEVIRECARADGIPEDVCPVITGAWSNVEAPGDFVRVHMHPWSVFSGVYYVQSDADRSGDLFLVDPRPGAGALYWPTSEVAERGAINLRGCAVADDAAEARRGNAFVFDVQILASHNPKAPGLCFCLQASSEVERAHWKAAIARAASRGAGAEYY